MKLSVSLSEQDLATLDKYVSSAGLASRSAGIQRAIGLLDDGDREQDYADAWQEWADSGEADAWEAVNGDGLTDAPR